MSHPLVKSVQLHKAEGCVYIGRRRKEKFHFGNPFSHLRMIPGTVQVKTREIAIANFVAWITKVDFGNIEPERRDWIIENLHFLRGKTLLCFCAPLDCHGDILAEMANRPEGI